MKQRNFRRDRILEEGLLDYIEFVNISSRNKEIVISYVNGCSYKELAEKHGVSNNRIPQIIREYIYHARKYVRGEK